MQRLEPAVARILAKSRRNNARAQIVGGLLFGDGCFLQCLEGEAKAVDTLYEKIASDPRHRDVKVLSRGLIHQRSFGAWSMKYVPGEQALGGLLHTWGLTRFDPFALSYQQIEAAVALMEQEADGAVTLPGGFEDGPQQGERESSTVRDEPPLLTKMHPSANSRPPATKATDAPKSRASMPMKILLLGAIAAIAAIGVFLVWALR
jgi:hypothetical protein